jgi:hypothetical protein
MTATARWRLIVLRAVAITYPPRRGNTKMEAHLAYANTKATVANARASWLGSQLIALACRCLFRD